MRIREFTGLLSAGILAAGLSVSMAGSAHAAVADPTVPDPIWNEINFPFLNGNGIPLCLDVPGGSMSVGTRLQLWRCHGYASNGGPQRWHFDNTGLPPREYKIWNTNSGLCIGFENNAVFSGARLVQEPCAQAPTWDEVLQNANGTDPLMKLVATNTGLEMASGSEFDNNGDPIVARPLSFDFTDAADILQLT
jgi:hypothetical protein